MRNERNLARRRRRTRKRMTCIIFFQILLSFLFAAACSSQFAAMALFRKRCATIEPLTVARWPVSPKPARSSPCVLGATFVILRMGRRLLFVSSLIHHVLPSCVFAQTVDARQSVMQSVSQSVSQLVSSLNSALVSRAGVMYTDKRRFFQA